MAIFSIQTDTTGQVGINPRTVRIICDNTLDEVVAPGFLNPSTQQGYSFLSTDQILIDYDRGQTSCTVSIAPGTNIITLTANQTHEAGPATVGNIATYIDTEGDIGQNANPAINLGNIQAGRSGSAAALVSFPPTALKGSLKLAAVDNTGNTVTTISNAAMGQASTISIPDPGVASSKFILSNSTGTQHINTGSLSIDQGDLSVGNSGAELVLHSQGTGVVTTITTATDLPGSRFLVINDFTPGDAGTTVAGIATNTFGITNTFHINLSTAQVQGMYATPVVILPVPLNFRSIVITSLQLGYSAGVTPFAGGGNIIVQYGSAAHGAGLSATLNANVVAATFLTSGAVPQSVFTTGALFSGNSSSFKNLEITISNDTAPFTSGDGTLDVYISYLEMPFA